MVYNKKLSLKLSETNQNKVKHKTAIVIYKSSHNELYNNL